MTGYSVDSNRLREAESNPDSVESERRRVVVKSMPRLGHGVWPDTPTRSRSAGQMT